MRKKPTAKNNESKPPKIATHNKGKDLCCFGKVEAPVWKRSVKLSAEDINPMLEKLESSLTSKNVASKTTREIYQSISSKLKGKVISTSSRVATIVKDAMRELLVEFLTPERRVDILHDVYQARIQGRPYIILLGGDDGVDKAMDLNKITYWLGENNCRVIIAGFNKFRAEALNDLREVTHPWKSKRADSILLHLDGNYSIDDPAGLAAAAIRMAIEIKYDVILVDAVGLEENLILSLSKVKCSIPGY